MKKKLALAAALLIGAGCAVYFFGFHHKPVSRQAAPAVTPRTAPQQTISGRYLFNGTIFWGRGLEYFANKGRTQPDLNYPFSQLDSFAPQDYDAWSGDLECPSADLRVPYQTQVDKLSFNCRPEYIPAAARYFQLVNLANNHTFDQGADAFAHTQQNLEKNGIQHYGNPHPGETADTCEVIALPIKLHTDKRPDQKKYLPVAFCAWHYLARGPEGSEITQIKRYADKMPVFAFVHMGVEYTPRATAAQESIMHQIVDNGASVVISNHPHWVQNSEAYKGKLIVYSTGNFIFDQQPLGSEEVRSASIDVSFNHPVDDNLEQWLALGADCQKFHDNCLQLAEQQHLSKVDVALKYDIVAGDSSHIVTKKGTPELLKSIEARLDWTQTLKGLGQ